MTQTSLCVTGEGPGAWAAAPQAVTAPERPHVGSLCPEGIASTCLQAKPFPLRWDATGNHLPTCRAEEDVHES